ncbi:UNVERIFIED_CONTAM: hypothetical protein Slati_4214100, partial [Sesamum latifolium]
RPSLSWRSILSVRDLIIAGSRWRIGSGNSVKIWSDRWIPRPYGFKPFIRPPNANDEDRVSSLINSGEGSSAHKEGWGSSGTEQFHRRKLKRTKNTCFFRAHFPGRRTWLTWSLSYAGVCGPTGTDGFGNWEGKGKDPAGVTFFAIQSWQEYREWGNCLQNPPNPQNTIRQWVPPPLGTFKINFDDAIFTELGACGVGIIARDAESCIAWRSKCFAYIKDPVHAELLAAAEAVKLAEEEGLSNVIIEGDCLFIIKKLCAAEEDLSPFRNLLQDIKMRAYSLGSCSFVHVIRCLNLGSQHC